MFRFVRMPFGLKSVPGTFSWDIDLRLSSVRSQHAPLYLGNFLIFSKTAEDQSEHVRSVLSLLQQAGAALKLKTCEFFSGTIGSLGRIIRTCKLEVAEHSRQTF